jgi:hypothetical protein
MVGPEPSKLLMPVRSRSSAPVFISGVAQRQSERLLTVGQRFESSHRSHLRASSGLPTGLQNLTEGVRHSPPVPA